MPNNSKPFTPTRENPFPPEMMARLRALEEEGELQHYTAGVRQPGLTRGEAIMKRRIPSLSKAVLFSLPSGYLVSNIGFDEATPLFREPVAVISERQDQWERIRELQVNNRSAWLFSDEAQWRACFGLGH